MFPNLVRAIALPRAGHAARRHFSILSAHTSFPATLSRLQTQRSSALSDYKQSGDVNDGIELSEHGLVRQRVSDLLPFSNGAVFMPNTFTMQEWVRTNYDYYVENLKEGQSASDTTILSVRKGTSIPRSLTLLHENLGRFSLQPSYPMSVTELNQILSEFYHQEATFTDAEEWMVKNEYHNATADNDMEKWTCQ